MRKPPSRPGNRQTAIAESAFSLDPRASGEQHRRFCERTVTTAAGPVAVKAPRVNDKRIDVETGERRRFSSTILAPWCRKSPKISEVLSLLYLHGLSSGDFVPAMEQFLGSSAGLSPTTVTRLTKQWTDDHTAGWQQRVTPGRTPGQEAG